MQVTQVDAFAERPFEGNPAAVCVLEAARPAAWMQAVAREMALSETAFLVPRPAGDFDLRWFTPATEVELCGHATLASAHVLWESGALSEGRPAIFRTRSGELRAEREGDRIVLDFPADPPAPCAAPPGLDEALGVAVGRAFRSRLYELVEVDHAAALDALAPRFDRLREVVASGVIVTCAAETPDADFFSRFFAPALGVDEDPVTGSAHCVLGPYWAARLGKQTLTGFQRSARGGRVHVELRGERVRLGGRAVTVLRGELVGAASASPPPVGSRP